MTPLEIAAKAAYENWIEPVKSAEPAWGELPEDFKLRLVEAQTAALLALAEVEPPEDVMKSGRDALLHEREWRISEAVQAREAFRAMLRSIAGGTNV